MGCDCTEPSNVLPSELYYSENQYSLRRCIDVTMTNARCTIHLAPTAATHAWWIAPPHRMTHAFTLLAIIKSWSKRYTSRRCIRGGAAPRRTPSITTAWPASAHLDILRVRTRIRRGVLGPASARLSTRWLLTSRKGRMAPSSTRSSSRRLWRKVCAWIATGAATLRKGSAAGFSASTSTRSCLKSACRTLLSPTAWWRIMTRRGPLHLCLPSWQVSGSCWTTMARRLSACWVWTLQLLHCFARFSASTLSSWGSQSEQPGPRASRTTSVRVNFLVARAPRVAKCATLSRRTWMTSSKTQWRVTSTFRRTIRTNALQHRPPSQRPSRVRFARNIITFLCSA